MSLRAAAVAVHLVCRCLHISSPAVGIWEAFTSQRILGVCSGIWYYTFECSETWFCSQFLENTTLRPLEILKKKIQHKHATCLASVVPLLLVPAKAKAKKFHCMTVRNVCALLFASFHFITTFIALIPFKGMQSYSKSGWQCVGMYAKCQLLSKPFFLGVREKMLLIRGLQIFKARGGWSCCVPRTRFPVAPWGYD